jgi:hypothetical protein
MWCPELAMGYQAVEKWQSAASAKKSRPLIGA